MVFYAVLFHGSAKKEFPAEAAIWNRSQISFGNTFEKVHFTVKFG